MKFLKKIEHYNRIFAYSLLKSILNTPQVEVPINNRNIKRILILRYDAIGDLIVTIPAIRLLKAEFPEAKIDVICSNRNINIAKNEPSISNSYVYDSTFKSLISLHKLKKNNYDIIISTVFNKKTKAGTVAKIISNKNTICIADLEVRRKEMYSTFFNAQIDVDDLRDRVTMLEILYNMFTRVFGFERDISQISKKIFIPKSSLENVNKFLNTNQIKEYIVYNISSGNDYRKLSLEKNLIIIKHLLEFNLQILIASDKSDREKAELLQSTLATEKCIYYPTQSISDAVAVVSKSKFVFTPDTSIIHIASAYDIPNFILYSSKASYVTEWLPFNCPYDVIVSKPNEPIENIEIDIIFEKLDKFLKLQSII